MRYTTLCLHEAHHRSFLSEAGGNPVRDWLLGLDTADRRTVGADMATVELGWPLGMPTCRALGDGLFEVRSTMAEGKVEARVCFHVTGATMLLLHGHSGKRGRDNQIALARGRLGDHGKRNAAAKTRATEAKRHR